MKISLELILRELTEEALACTLKHSKYGDFSAMNLAGICSFDTATQVKSGTLYLVVPGCDLQSDPVLLGMLEKSDAVLCVLENLAAELESYQITYLCIINENPAVDDTPAADYRFYNQVFSRLYDIFQKYASWQENLYLAVENENIQVLLDVSQPIFRKSIYVAGNEGKYLAASGPCLDYLGVQSQVPLEVFNHLKNETAIEPSLSTQETFLYPAGILNADALCKDIFENNVYFCRIIIIDEINRTGFDPGDYHLMALLGNALQLMIRQNNLAVMSDQGNPDSSSSLITIIDQLLTNQRVDASQLDTVLFRNGWKKNEGCHVGCLLLYPYENQLMNSHYYNRYITRNFTGVYSLDRKDHLILIIRESVYPKADHFLSQFNLFIRDGNFRFGISNLCADLMQLAFFQRQAEIAVDDGLRKDQTIWCHKFANLAFSHLLQEACHEMPAELLCAPELLVLKNYDCWKKTDYYLTLKTYLENKMIATQTAKALFIHHATMVYRLKRMQELTGIDYDDSEKMLYLYLSFKMLDNNC
ncbi:MAG: helix-turn-helix domain-containing protein [Acetobacterium woodii]|nr:helix-turn-helix domain-containing protein [Acetobacterium woodii]